MDEHSPLPWRLKELPTGDIEILDANGDLVHSNSMYYPTGISHADARLIIQYVNAAHDFARLTASDFPAKTHIKNDPSDF